MKIFWGYLKSHIKGICYYVGFIGIFYLIFYLYEIHTDAVHYAFLISFVWLFINGVADFIRYIRIHNELVSISESITLEWKPLPSPRDQIETDYQSMLLELYDRKVEIESESGIARQDMLDYYSLWVHQIKTPISALRVLLQSQIEYEGAQFVKEMKMELFKIEQYVEMVLSYLRMEEMSGDLVLQWYTVDEIVKKVVRKYSQMFILQKIKLDFHSLDEMVLTDEKWLAFVLEQLLSNALKYTKTGKISIYMDAQGEDKRLVMEDTGIGIQEEDLPRVFEKGFTGYNGRTDRKSTGIGLYLCKTVMDRLNHGISIESEPGIGTRVALNLKHRDISTE